MPELIWEEIKSSMGFFYRAKVVGGWLVKEVFDVITNPTENLQSYGFEYRGSLTFIPDPNYSWEGVKSDG